MKRTIYTLSFLFFSLLFVFSCMNKQRGDATAKVGDENTTLLYAELFTISHQENYTKIVVFNPWRTGEIYAQYYLVKADTVTIPADGDKVLVPVKALMVNSATHLGFLDLLNGLDCVTGVCSTDYIYNSQIRERVSQREILDLGDAFNLDIERLLLLHPQAVMTTAYNAEDENSRRMKQTGLTLLYNIEWQEKTLLGRAEWIKFVGAFLDREALADSVFSGIEQRYNKVKELASTVANKPTVLSGQDFRGTWSMPGGKSFNARLFSDAGADYYYKNDHTLGSISSTIEEALIYFSQADVWVGVQENTLTDLARMDAKYKLFKAWQEGRVYNTNKRVTTLGGNDYWESGVSRPDLLLSDMIKIFHPELLPDYELTYLQRLSQ